MIRIALVGDIGSGKSYIAKLFNYPIFNADYEVSIIYKKNKKCFKNIKENFPNHKFSFPIKKKELVNCISNNVENLKKISKIVHPIVRSRLNLFLKRNHNKKFVILDIPLFLENKMNKKKDIIIFIQANKNQIQKRLNKRIGFNKKLVKLLRKMQLPLHIKKKKSNMFIKNNFSNKFAKKNVKYIFDNI
tara:strand:+ start:1580 stop:2146 length:567 start_codon:yes stop_codon:yes gene_type:complete